MTIYLALPKTVQSCIRDNATLVKGTFREHAGGTEKKMTGPRSAQSPPRSDTWGMSGFVAAASAGKGRHFSPRFTASSDVWGSSGCYVSILISVAQKTAVLTRVERYARFWGDILRQTPLSRSGLCRHLPKSTYFYGVHEILQKRSQRRVHAHSRSNDNMVPTYRRMRLHCEQSRLTDQCFSLSLSEKACRPSSGDALRLRRNLGFNRASDCDCLAH